MKVRTSVDADLRAFHTDPVNDPALNEGRHEHVWNGTGDPIACVVTRPGYRAEVWL